MTDWIDGTKPYRDGSDRATVAVDESALDVERTLIGTALCYPSSVAVIRQRIDATDFYRERHRSVWSTILAVADRGEPPTFALVVDELVRVGTLDGIGGVSYLVDCCASIATSVYAEYDAARLARDAERRRLLLAGGRVENLARDRSLTADDAVSQAQAIVASVARTRSTRPAALTPFELAAEASARNRARLDTGEPGVLSWGFLDLDAKTAGGARRGQLVVVGGKTAMGKTALLRAFSRSFAKTGSVLFATNEMTPSQLTDRDLAVYSGVPLATILDGHWTRDERARIVAAEQRIADTALYSFFDFGMTTAKLRQHARELNARVGLVAIVVDYLQQMRDPGNRKIDQVGHAIGGLKALALELDVPVIVGSQLSRGDRESGQASRPTLESLRESGEIEQAADVVILLYRPSYYYPTADSWTDAKQKGSYPGNIAELIVAKQRQGESGVAVNVAFLPNTVTFANLARRADPVPF